jgi:lipopolysaccharide/colanic/teichoic acid biosynthesis glycosyltransferase
MKRLVDILVAVPALILLAGPMLLIAVLIRRESPGDSVFRQRRAGWKGRPFVMLKFRTMRTDVDSYGASPRSDDDPRLTRTGKVLRETSLDELPQLVNVLLGQMSLVGPRPLYERQAALWDSRQRRRLDVRPGLTGYAQVRGRGELTHEDKIELDLYYVDNRSFRFDMKILWWTLAAALHRRGGDTYEQRYSKDRDREVDSQG